MDVIQALEQRKSVRAYTGQPVDTETINRILTAAGHSPSGANTQPWQVAVVSGEARQALGQKLETAFRSGYESKKDYTYYPNEWVEPYTSRRRACGFQLYDTLGIDKGDRQGRLDQWAANYRAFDAPVMLLFFIDPILEKGSYIDYGMFLQSIMLAAVEHGLATCPQAALGEYPDVVKEALDMPEGITLLGGMALGYEDKEALVNSYRTPREPIEAFVKYFS